MKSECKVRGSLALSICPLPSQVWYRVRYGNVKWVGCCAQNRSTCREHAEGYRGDENPGIRPFRTPALECPSLRWLPLSFARQNSVCYCHAIDHLPIVILFPAHRVRVDRSMSPPTGNVNVVLFCFSQGVCGSTCPHKRRG